MYQRMMNKTYIIYITIILLSLKSFLLDKVNIRKQSIFKVPCIHVTVKDL